jgi:hypothetical protein
MGGGHAHVHSEDGSTIKTNSGEDDYDDSHGTDLSDTSADEKDLMVPKLHSPSHSKCTNVQEDAAVVLFHSCFPRKLRKSLTTK